MIVFYINDSYTPATKAALQLANIKMPQFELPYTIRSVYMLKDMYHILLNEIENEKIGDIEPGFAYYRFTNIPDNILEWEKVDQLFKKQ